MSNEQPTTEQRQQAVLNLLREGLCVATALRCAGVPAGTFKSWKSRHAEFREATRQARAEAERDALRVVRAGKHGWQGAAWFLERSFTERWGRYRAVREFVELPEDLSKLSDDELKALAKGKALPPR